VRVPLAEYLNLKLRTHELLGDVPNHDDSAVDLPRGVSGRSLADVRALESSTPPGRAGILIFGLLSSGAVFR
jgi:hypothetical protein